MKAYGVPRDFDLQSPDVGTIGEFGLKSCAGSIRGKSGEFRGINKNSASKKRTRRRFKRNERARAVLEIQAAAGEGEK